MKIKKTFFGLGALATAIAPVAVASQCGEASAAPSPDTKTAKTDGTSITPNVKTISTGQQVQIQQAPASQQVQNQPSHAGQQQAQQPITLDLSADKARLLHDLSEIAGREITDSDLLNLPSLTTDDQRERFGERKEAAGKETITKVIAFIHANGGKELKIIAPGLGTFIHTFTGAETQEQILQFLSPQNSYQPITLDLSADKAKLLQDLSKTVGREITDSDLLNLPSWLTDDQRKSFIERKAAAGKEMVAKVVAFIHANGGKELKIIAPGLGTFIHTFTGAETQEQILEFLSPQNSQQPQP